MMMAMNNPYDGWILMEMSENLLRIFDIENCEFRSEDANLGCAVRIGPNAPTICGNMPQNMPRGILQ